MFLLLDSAESICLLPSWNICALAFSVSIPAVFVGGPHLKSLFYVRYFHINQFDYNFD